MEREHWIAINFIADRYPAATMEEGAEPGTVIISGVDAAGASVGPRWVIDENGCVVSHDGVFNTLLEEYVEHHLEEMMPS